MRGIHPVSLKPAHLQRRRKRLKQSSGRPRVRVTVDESEHRRPFRVKVAPLKLLRPTALEDDPPVSPPISPGGFASSPPVLQLLQQSRHDREQQIKQQEQQAKQQWEQQQQLKQQRQEQQQQRQSREKEEREEEEEQQQQSKDKEERKQRRKEKREQQLKDQREVELRQARAELKKQKKQAAAALAGADAPKAGAACGPLRCDACDKPGHSAACCPIFKGKKRDAHPVRSPPPPHMPPPPPRPIAGRDDFS